MKRSAPNGATASASASGNVQDTTAIHIQSSLHSGSADKRRKHDDDNCADHAEIAASKSQDADHTHDAFRMPQPMIQLADIKEEPDISAADEVPNAAGGGLLVRSVSQINRSPDLNLAGPISTTVGIESSSGQSTACVNAPPIVAAAAVDVSHQMPRPNTEPCSSATNASEGAANIKIEIKTEVQIKEESAPPPPAATNCIPSSTSSSSSSTDPASSSSIGVQVKLEPDSAAPTVTTPTVAAAPTAAPAPRTSRPVCNFGIKCFRRNLQHRNDMAHPGDPDYRRPAFPPAPPGTPDCPFGARCYRRNPQHFQQLSHPPSDVYDTDLMGGGPMPMPPRVPPAVVPAAAAARATANNVRVFVGYSVRGGNSDTATDIDFDNDDDDEDDYDDDEADPYLDGSSSDEYQPTESATEYDDDFLASSDSEGEY